MSTIGLKYHNEDIHNIIKKPMPPVLKTGTYKSKQKREKSDASSLGGRARRKSSNKRECFGSCRTSEIPKPITIERKPPKNFLKENMKKLAEIEVKVAAPRRVETPRGTVKDLAHQLQMIKIRESEEYGKIPKYLSIRKQKELKERERLEREKRALEEYREKMGIGTMGMGENFYKINDETRQRILDGLKENWNELSKQFLKLPVMTDTWPKIKRKMMLEKEIEQLEKDIRLVESHPFIYLEGIPIMEREPSEEKVQGEEPKPEPQQEETPEKEESEEKEAEQIAPLAEVDEKKDEDTEIHVHNY